MNVKLLFRLLGILSLLIGLFMVFSIFWCNPRFGYVTDSSLGSNRFEREGFRGLALGCLISVLTGGVFWLLGRGAEGKLFRKEAMAVVGLGWVLATVLGALPYVFAGTSRGPTVRVDISSKQVFVIASAYQVWRTWNRIQDVSDEEFELLRQLVDAGGRGFSGSGLRKSTGMQNAVSVFRELRKRKPFDHCLIGPGQGIGLAPADRASNYRLRWVKVSLLDAMFESQSGFSTTGATVFTDLEDPYHIPRSILFWRASTHFLGGLGIIVLFVVILGQGSEGKALMRAEVPGPTHESTTARIQHTAWLFAAMYVGLNVALALILFVCGLSLYDAICHAFATMATGGFSTYNASLGHFAQIPGINGPLIESIVIVFMVLAGTNFTLLALCLFGQPWHLGRDIEWQTYVSIIAFGSVAVIAAGLLNGDDNFSGVGDSLRYGLFQIVSIVTTTGFCTADFDRWNDFSRGLILALMFIGGCAGSTGGGMKVIRHVLFVKILGIEIEHSFHPRVVRLLRINNKPVDDDTLRHTILVYFALILMLFVAGSLLVAMVEPDTTWAGKSENKLLDTASAVASTLNNIGPGLGTVGATQNYGHFGSISKLVFIFLMMLGRLEIFPVLVLLAPKFWRDL